jgi:benzoate membrane transport protein
MTTIENVGRNLRDLPRALTLSTVAAGFIAALVGYTGPLLIVLQAAQNANLTPEQTSSWVWAIAVGNGVMSILMSLYFRQPLIAPWPTASAALLVTSLAAYTFPQAVGAFILAGLLIALLGATGLFARMMEIIPQPVVLGMLAGILLRFGLGLFTAIPESPLMVVSMIVVFFLLRRLQFRAPLLGSLIVGMVIAVLQGQLSLANVSVALTTPQLTPPEFTLNAAINLAVPLFILSVTSQFAPGQAVLRSFGYTAPINKILVILGLGSVAIAPFGGHGLSLGALTSAMLASPDSHPDPDKRYAASFANGFFYLLFGLFGTTVVSLFAGFPPALVAAVAGLALSGTISASLTNGLANPEQRDGAVIAFLVAASGVSLLGIGAPFWGLVAGVLVNAVLNVRKPVTVRQSQT